MTATPKVYGVVPKKQAAENSAVIYSMDDESVFGPVFYSLTFEQAVTLGCLVDYKVIILIRDSSVDLSAEKLEQFSANNVSRAIGLWKSVNKYGVLSQNELDPQPIRRVVAYAERISTEKMAASKNKANVVASKEYAQYFGAVIESYRQQVLAKGRKALAEQQQPSEEFEFVESHNLLCHCEHIDGGMDAVAKEEKLQFLRSDPDENECHILFNVRCLSEGVDVPSLDAVALLTPRSSPVEVVQIVGRVMRTAPGKKEGYVIIPVIAHNLKDPASALANSPEFRVVWEILNALRSISPESVLVDPYLHKLDKRIAIVCESNQGLSRKRANNEDGEVKAKKTPPQDPDAQPEADGSQQDLFKGMAAFEIEEKIKSTIIDTIGNRKTWEEWAKDVGAICSRQVELIKGILNSPDTSEQTRQAFARFHQELIAATNVNLNADDVIEMLAQHIVIKPVLDALFPHYPFSERNVIACSMTRMLDQLDQNGLKSTNEELQSFYNNVQYRMSNVESVSDRQKVIIQLFDQFFKVAFPKQQEKLGIVYTPVEIVDFMLHSVSDLLQREFGESFSSSNVHVLDPFTGTGTFIAQLLQSNLISDEALENKYRHELHAFEILPLAYYIAAINIESVYNQRYKDMHGHEVPVEEYQSNSIVVLTDTFNYAAQEGSLDPNNPFVPNSELRREVESLELRVILGNPPYSAGQDSQNDDNQNEKYPALDARIAETYVARADTSQLKSKIYDSYIRAFRWASDKITKRGIIAFVTNAGWLETASANGLRRCLTDEFSSIFVYHLKGNARTSGEQRRKEKDNVFGEGSRAPIAITLLVKNPAAAEQGQIYFATVDDYLTREQKLQQLRDMGSVLNPQVPLIRITPDAHGDWFNQRRDDFAHFITVDGKNNDDLAIFANYSLGIVTSRDSWSYNASKEAVVANMSRCIATYNEQVEQAKLQGDAFEMDNDPTKIKWDRPQRKHVKIGRIYPAFSESKIVLSLYRPFFKEWLYNDRAWINCVYQMPQLFPFAGAENLTIGVCGVGGKNFSCLMFNAIPDLNSLEAGAQCFPRYLYRSATKAELAAYRQAHVEGYEDTSSLLGELETDVLSPAPQASSLLDVVEHDASVPKVIVNGYVREDAIKPEAIAHFQKAYAGHEAEIDADAVFYYIYGLLHSTDYRSTYANNLQKELPRIPRVATWDDFKAFMEAGRKLAKLHVGYEQVTPYQGCKIEGLAPNVSKLVTKLEYGKNSGKKGAAAKDKTVIKYNDSITITDIPLEAQEYVVNRKSALDWVVERCCISVDKDSRIANDYNAFAQEMGDEDYILNLILRVITVSLETMKIVKALPKLTIHQLDS